MKCAALIKTLPPKLCFQLGYLIKDDIDSGLEDIGIACLKITEAIRAAKLEDPTLDQGSFKLDFNSISSFGEQYRVPRDRKLEAISTITKRWGENWVFRMQTEFEEFNNSVKDWASIRALANVSGSLQETLEKVVQQAYLRHNGTGRTSVSRQRYYCQSDWTKAKNIAATVVLLDL